MLERPDKATFVEDAERVFVSITIATYTHQMIAAVTLTHTNLDHISFAGARHVHVCKSAYGLMPSAKCELDF